MGAGNSTNPSKNNSAPSKNIATATASSHQLPLLPVLLSEDPSLSASLIAGESAEVISTTDSFSPISVDVISDGGSTAPDVDTVVTLWKPTASDDLIFEDIENGVYIEGSASVILAPNSIQKKRKNCSCLCCKRRRRRQRVSGEGMGSVVSENPSNSSSGNFDEYTTAEVISVHSRGDMALIPSEIFPLEMIATMDFPNGPTSNSKITLQNSKIKVKPKKSRRNRVPEKPDRPMSLWGLLKSAIGKDLTKFPLPVNFAEPLSMLQRLAEDYEYSSILDKASKTTDSLEQLAYVAAFAISSYASTAVRTAKPFNPLLGETYEFDRMDDLGWRCIAEQVCHHPPIAALHCESSGWVQWQQFTMKSNFRGTYLEIHPLGVAHLRFKTSENHYTWHKVTTVIRNLYIGKLYIEQEGEMDIINHSTSEWCHLKFTCGGMWSRDRNVTGKIYNKASEPTWELTGSWDKEMSGTRLDEKGKPIPGETRTLWGSESLPSDAEKHYWFSRFACQLNDMEEGVAPTDSRNRTDQRLMENAQWDEANAEKQRLEDKQRETRKKRCLEGNHRHSTASYINAKPVLSGNTKNAPVSGPEDGIEPFYTPSWFSRQRDPISGQYIYMYNGEYWSCKENRDWERCPVLYDK